METWGSIKTRPHNELAASRVVLVDGSGEEDRQCGPRNLDLLSSPLGSSSVWLGWLSTLASAFPAITIRDYGKGEGQQAVQHAAEGAELNKLKVRSILPTLS
jgi:hypothetical protein